jgi:hypothetical protein
MRARRRAGRRLGAELAGVGARLRSYGGCRAFRAATARPSGSGPPNRFRWRLPGLSGRAGCRTAPVAAGKPSREPGPERDVRPRASTVSGASIPAAQARPPWLAQARSSPGPGVARPWAARAQPCGARALPLPWPLELCLCVIQALPMGCSSPARARSAPGLAQPRPAQSSSAQPSPETLPDQAPGPRPRIRPTVQNPSPSRNSVSSPSSSSA